MDAIDWKFLFTSYEGRINRQLWWIGVGIIFAVSVIANFLIGSEGFIQLILGILLLLAGLALHIKRCHDRDKSGWWCLLLLIPVVGFIWAVVDLGILEGTNGPNSYGPRPARGPGLTPKAGCGRRLAEASIEG